MENPRFLLAGECVPLWAKREIETQENYHGQRHTVTVAPDGFDWQCTSARSRHARQIYLK